MMNVTRLRTKLHNLRYITQTQFVISRCFGGTNDISFEVEPTEHDVHSSGKAFVLGKHKDTTHKDEKHSKVLKMAVLVVVVCTYLVVWLYPCILPHSHTARNKILSFCQATKATAPSNQERKSWIERRFKTPKKVYQ